MNAWIRALALAIQVVMVVPDAPTDELVPITREDYYTMKGATGEYRVAVATPESASGTAVVIVPGAYGNDVDGDYPSLGLRPHLYADIAHLVTEVGFTSVRYARLRDDWLDAPMLNFETVDASFDDRVRDLRRAIGLALKQRGIRRVLLIAHSDGCIVAARVHDRQISGMLGVSCPMMRLFDLGLARVAAYQGASSVAYNILKNDTFTVRSGKVPHDTEDRVEPFFFGSLSAGPIDLLREMDRIEPCGAYRDASFPITLVVGHDDVLGIGTCAPPNEVETRRLSEGDHYMQVAGISVIPWIVGEPALSSAFVLTMQRWLEQSDASSGKP